MRKVLWLLILVMISIFGLVSILSSEQCGLDLRSSCASSGGPTYSILYTLPHSGQRATGRSRDICKEMSVILCQGTSMLTLCHSTTWESAGHPVQPANCSSPNERTIIGSSRVPGAGFHQPRVQIHHPLMPGNTYLYARHPMASCRTHQLLLFSRGSRIARVL